MLPLNERDVTAKERKKKKLRKFRRKENEEQIAIDAIVDNEFC